MNINDEHFKVPATGKCCSDEFGPTEHDNGGIIGEHMCKLASSGVTFECVNGRANLGVGVTGAQNSSAEPDKRRRTGLTLHHASTGGDEALGIVGVTR
jgi:hypothetical protein